MYMYILTRVLLIRVQHNTYTRVLHNTYSTLHVLHLHIIPKAHRAYFFRVLIWEKSLESIVLFLFKKIFFPLQLAWAPGRGVKGAGLKGFWDQEIGASFIPWNFIKGQGDVNNMAEGGWVDPPTCPPGMKPPPPPAGVLYLEEKGALFSSTQ